MSGRDEAGRPTAALHDPAPCTSQCGHHTHDCRRDEHRGGNGCEHHHCGWRVSSAKSRRPQQEIEHGECARSHSTAARAQWARSPHRGRVRDACDGARGSNDSRHDRQDHPPRGTARDAERTEPPRPRRHEADRSRLDAEHSGDSGARCASPAHELGQRRTSACKSLTRKDDGKNRCCHHPSQHHHCLRSSSIGTAERLVHYPVEAGADRCRTPIEAECLPPRRQATRLHGDGRRRRHRDGLGFGAEKERVSEGAVTKRIQRIRQ